MPKAASRKPGQQTATRAAPYPAMKPSSDNESQRTPLIAHPANTTVSRTQDVDAKPAFLDITLPGEDTDSVPVLDSCAEIRVKIRAWLSKDPGSSSKEGKSTKSSSKTQPSKDGGENENENEGVKGKNRKPMTAKYFCELLGVSTASYTNFMKKGGVSGKRGPAMDGAENKTYYRAYVFFEKKRVWEGEGKSKHRLAIEEKWSNGLELKDPARWRVWVRKGENPRDFIPKLYGGKA